MTIHGVSIKGGKRRLFFALWPDAAVRGVLARAASEAVRRCGGRVVPEASWHATLVFLGSTPEDKLAAVTDAAARVPFTSFQLNLDRLEYWMKPALLCAVASAPPPAARELTMSLREAVARQGFLPDLKPWRPHVVVARKVFERHADVAIEPIEWSVRQFALVDSETAPEGSRYTVLKIWPA